MTKSKLIAVITTVLATVGLNVIVGCMNDNPNESKPSSAAESFMSALCQNYYELETTPLSPSVSTRSGSCDLKEDCAVIKVQFPEGTPPEDKEIASLAKTVQDISSLYRITAAELTVDADDFFGNEKDNTETIVLSEDKARTLLVPYVKASIDYLIAQGLTENQIDSIKKVTNVTDEDLVIATMLLLNQELKNHETKIAKSKIKRIHIFATPCYAVNYSGIMDCGLQAIGMDIFYGISQSAAKTWSVKVIIKAFGTVAKKAIGPIGAAIAVGEFSYCMYKKYGGGYSIKVPSNKMKIDEFPEYGDTCKSIETKKRLR